MQPLAVGIGELLWDVFPSGRRLGGAPANFACHVSRLGCRGAVASRVGDDALGREALARLQALGVDTRWIQTDPALPTGTVSVTVDPRGHPTYAINGDVAWEALEGSGPLDELAREAQAICYGTLTARNGTSMAAVRRVLEGAGPGCLRIFDVNLRHDFYTPALIRSWMGLCDVLKLNEDELPVVAELCGVTGDLVEGLRSRFGLRLVALTLGDRGSILRTATERLEAPGAPVQVVDTVGAGDAFTAAVAAGLLLGMDLPDLHRLASALSAYVCTQEGATPDIQAFLSSWRRG